MLVVQSRLVVCGFFEDSDVRHNGEAGSARRERHGLGGNVLVEAGLGLQNFDNFGDPFAAEAESFKFAVNLFQFHGGFIEGGLIFIFRELIGHKRLHN